VDDKRIDEVLELTGILSSKRKSEEFFSWYEAKARVGCGNFVKAELVILDEPLNGLDVEGMIEIRKLIKALAENERTTFFISSHLIHDVEITCNRIGILYDGKLVNVDTTENILKNFASLENYFVSEVGKNESV